MKHKLDALFKEHSCNMAHRECIYPRHMDCIVSLLCDDSWGLKIMWGMRIQAGTTLGCVFRYRCVFLHLMEAQLAIGNGSTASPTGVTALRIIHFVNLTVCEQKKEASFTPVHNNNTMDEEKERKKD